MKRNNIPFKQHIGTVLVIFFLFYQAGFAELFKVTDGATNEHSHFGWDVAMSEKYALVSAANENNEFGPCAGAVYVYELVDGAWANVQKLTAPDAAANAYFGHAVAMDSSLAVISAIGSFANGPFSGCAYIFRRQGSLWHFEKKITPKDGAPIARFGQSVDVNQDLVLVGAPQAFGTAPNSGAAYIFRYAKAEWRQEAKLVADDGLSDDFFGWSVALNNNGSALVGAYSATGNVEKAGAAYLFERMQDGWMQTAKLFADDGGERDLFAYSVDLTDNHALIGAYQHQDEGQSCGAAYLFHFDGSTWTQRHLIQHSQPNHHDYFGIEVCLSHKIAAVSASRDENDEEMDKGAVYLFEYTSDAWHEIEKLTPEDGAAHDHFGLSVDMFGPTVLVGARSNDNNTDNDGAAYFSSPGSLTSVETAPAIPKVFALHQNYPNPFNPTTTIKFDLPAPELIKLTIYDILGHQVRTLVHKKYAAGYHAVVWDGLNDSGLLVGSGMYVCKIKAGDHIVSKKMTFLK